MTLENATGLKTFQATATAIPAFCRVKCDSSGLISAANATDAMIGVTVSAARANGYCTVKLVNCDETVLMTANGAITAGAILYPAASGKVSASGTTAIGYAALEAATADGDVIECSKGFKGA